MTLYINKRLYTDVESYKVIEMNEKGDVATVIKVEKVPQNLQFEVGGFAAHCVNNEEAFDNAPIVEVEGAKPFKVKLRKNGYWYKENDVGYSIDKRLVDMDKIELQPDEIMEVDDFSVHILKLTKTGKRKKCYTKFGKMSEKCLYYYDYNF